MRLLTTCVVKLAQLIDMTRCASYDVSAMTNSAANVHILDCVSFEQSVWRSFRNFVTSTRQRCSEGAAPPCTLFLADVQEWRLDMRSDCEQEATTHTENVKLCVLCSCFAFWRPARLQLSDGGRRGGGLDTSWSREGGESTQMTTLVCMTV